MQMNQNFKVHNLKLICNRSWTERSKETPVYSGVHILCLKSRTIKLSQIENANRVNWENTEVVIDTFFLRKKIVSVLNLFLSSWQKNMSLDGSYDNSDALFILDNELLWHFEI